MSTLAEGATAEGDTEDAVEATGAEVGGAAIEEETRLALAVQICIQFGLFQGRY